jgi:hypothetical protein
MNALSGMSNAGPERHSLRRDKLGAKPIIGLMERLNPLAIALGLAALAGVNLYLTVFVTGLAIHFHWINLGPQYQSLEILANPWIIAIAGVLYFLEFFADKIPWVDSIWDAVHTIIRPIGGAVLALQVLGHPNPAFATIVALLGGGTSLVSHTAKAATRLAANTSPEPFSNIALSVGEDVAVVAGLTLIYHNPLIALAVFVLAMAAFLYFAPKILRATRAKVWLAWKKLNLPERVEGDATLPTALPARLAELFKDKNVGGETIAWAVPCLSGRVPHVPANVRGALVALNEDPRKLFFLAQRRGRKFFAKIDLTRTSVTHEPKFLSENVSIAPTAAKAPVYSFIFPRSDAELVTRICDDLRIRVSTPIWPLESTDVASTAPAAAAVN